MNVEASKKSEGATVGVGYSAWYASVRPGSPDCNMPPMDNTWTEHGRGAEEKARRKEQRQPAGAGREAGTRVCEASGLGRWSATPVTGRNRVLRGLTG